MGVSCVSCCVLLGNLDLVGLKQVFKADNNPWVLVVLLCVVRKSGLSWTEKVFKADNNPWVPPIEDQLRIGVSHVFDYIRTDTYKL